MYRPAWRINQIGVRGTGWRRQAFTKMESGADIQEAQLQAQFECSIFPRVEAGSDSGASGRQKKKPFNKLGGSRQSPRTSGPRLLMVLKEFSRQTKKMQIFSAVTLTPELPRDATISSGRRLSCLLSFRPLF